MMTLPERSSYRSGAWLSGAGLAITAGALVAGVLTGASDGQSGAGSLAPRAWYTSDDIERARTNIERHGWAKRIAEGYVSAAAPLLGMNAEDVRAFVPRQTPVITVACPRCNAGPWYWSHLVDDGATLECNSCGARFPWDPNDETETWNVQAVVRRQRLGYIAEAMEKAAIVYRLNADRRYADRAAVGVARFAEVFRHYRMNKVNQNVWMDTNHPYYGKISGWKAHDAYIVSQMLKTYDLIRDAGVLSAAQMAAIDRDLVRYSADYFVGGFEGTDPLAFENAIQDQGYIWLCMAASGAMLGDDSLTQRVAAHYKRMLDPANGIFREDGAFYQFTPNYNWGLLKGMVMGPAILRRSGVDVYHDPDYRLLEKALTWFLDASFPDGTVPALNDSHVHDRMPPNLAEIAYHAYGNKKAFQYLKDTWGDSLDQGTEDSLFTRDPDAATHGGGEPYGVGSVQLSGIGLEILRHGAPKPDQTMAFIDYGAWEPKGHKHQDYLNFNLWAHGLEMVPEFGYPWNPAWARMWGRSAIAHNTILEVSGQLGAGRSLAWVDLPRLKLAEAGLPPANARMIALLPREQGSPLVVDVFRAADERVKSFTWVTWARSEDISLQGVTSWRDVDAVPPLRGSRRGTVTGRTIEALWQFPGAPARSLRLLMPVRGRDEVTLSAAPPEESVIASTHSPGGILKPGVMLPTRGHLQVHRAGPAAIFATVYVPATGTPDFAVRVHWRDVPRRPEAVALEIESGRERFVFVHDPAPGRTEYAGLSFDGRAAVSTYRDGTLAALCLADGRSARQGSAHITLASSGNACVERTAGGVFAPPRR